MINLVKQLSFVVCISAVSLSFIEMLAPQKKFEKIFKLFISLYFLTVLITPFLEIKDFANEAKASMNTVNDSYEDNNIKSTVTQRLNREIAGTIEAQLKSQLKAEKITPDKIETEFEQKENGEIEVKSIKVYIPAKSNYSDSKIKKIVKSQVECEVLIVKQ